NRAAGGTQRILRCCVPAKACAPSVEAGTGLVYTDERGTREYNMALGERRAKAVQRYLVLQGVSPAQAELVSYGKERPVATGHDEQSWAQNRRVELRK
ncbi:OmpA family protein, partial [Pseudomonas fluorescens]|uniref:OmpA family protein n=1 Tax=Pseudomonas fluorescens TaxID=294 RepID=UPI003D013DCF